MSSKVIILLKKELVESIATFKYPVIFTLIIILSIFAGLGGTEMLKYLDNRVGIEQSILLGLSNSRGISSREIAILYAPLLVVFLSGDIISRELESRNIIRLLSTPISRKQFYVAKLTALYILLVTICLVSTSIPLYIIYLNVGRSLTPEDLTRVISFIYIYIIYLCIWGTLGLLLSSLFKKTLTSMLVLFVIFIVLSPLWVNLSLIIAGSFNVPPSERISIEYNIKMLSITEMFDEALNFILNPHFIKISNGQWIYDWNKKISLIKSLSLIVKDLYILTIILIVLIIVTYIMLKKLQVTPRT